MNQKTKTWSEKKYVVFHENNSVSKIQNKTDWVLQYVLRHFLIKVLSNSLLFDFNRTYSKAKFDCLSFQKRRKFSSPNFCLIQVFVRARRWVGPIFFLLGGVHKLCWQDEVGRWYWKFQGVADFSLLQNRSSFWNVGPG